MRFVDHGDGGGLEVLHIAECAQPEPGPGEVLIRVAYAGVNHHDLLQRTGHHPEPSGISPILGLEVSGWCAAVGPDVTRWKVGDALCALVPGGGYAEYCTAPAEHCLVLPEGASLQQATALPEACFTVWANIFELGRLAPGERLLIHGGSSGVGIIGIQMALAHGAKVATTVGNAHKQSVCRELGAQIVVNYHEQDFPAVIAGEWDAVDVILDMVGGDYLARNVALLARGGRLVQIAHLNGAQGQLDIDGVMRRNLTITGSTMRGRTAAEKAELARTLERKVWPWVANGALRPVIHAVYPLDQAADAHRELEGSKHVGKVLLDVAGDDDGE